MTAPDLPVLDPAALTAAQRRSGGCVVCGKRWPRPRQRAGTMRGAVVHHCAECVLLLEPVSP